MFALMNKIISISGKYKWRIYAAFVLAFIKMFVSKAPLILSFTAISRFVNGSMTAGVCIRLFAAMMICILVQIVLQNAADRLQSAAGYMMFDDLRIRMSDHLRRMPMGYFTEGNIGKITSVMGTDMVFIEENCMNAIGDLMSDLFAQIVMVVMCFYLNVWVGAASAVIVIIMLIVGRGTEAEAVVDSANRQEASETLTESVLDYVEGIGIIKSYNMLGDRSKALADAFANSCERNLAFEENHTPWQRGMGIVYSIGTAVIMGLGYYLYAADAISLTYFIGILLFSFGLFAPMRTFYGQVSRLTVMSSCIDRMNEVFDELELADTGTTRLAEASGDAAEISFEDVTFSYGRKEVIHHVSFTAARNTMTALVGPSGGGKSTIAYLVARFWDVSGGAVKIRGVNVKDIPLAELMNNISMVFQRVYLFEDTVYNNIAMGRPAASREEVIEAAKKARCYDFIMALPDGFDTVLSEGGSSLSGGERQRISIARCILKDAPIVILDEATASVDVDNEVYIQQAISELCRGKTLLVIAHRLNTIAGADKIIVIRDGRIDQQGRHEELIAVDGTYKNFISARTNMVGWNQA